MYLMNGLTLVHIVCWAGSRYRNELQIYVNINHLQPEILAYCSDGAFFTASRLRVCVELAIFSLSIHWKLQTKENQSKRDGDKRKKERETRALRGREI